MELTQYDKYILDEAFLMLNNYVKEWSSFLDEDQKVLLNESLDYLYLIAFKLEERKDTHFSFDIKTYTPNIEPIKNYSIFYEFESFVDCLLDEDSLADEEKEKIKYHFFILEEMLDTWYDFKFGYHLHELEEDMIKNNYGVFHRNTTENEFIN